LDACRYAVAFASDLKGIASALHDGQDGVDHVRVVDAACDVDSGAVTVLGLEHDDLFGVTTDDDVWIVGREMICRCSFRSAKIRVRVSPTIALSRLSSGWSMINGPFFARAIRGNIALLR
jgi:hypothetical protein